MKTLISLLLFVPLCAFGQLQYGSGTIDLNINGNAATATTAGTATTAATATLATHLSNTDSNAILAAATNAAIFARLTATNCAGCTVNLNAATATTASSVPILNLTSTVHVMGSDSNQIALNRETWYRAIAGPGQLSNVTGSGWSTLVLSNTTASDLPFYLTNSSWLQIGDSTTNVAPAGVLSVPAHKKAYITVDNQTSTVDYWITLQRP